jgi:hypothetical protein
VHRISLALGALAALLQTAPAPAADAAAPPRRLEYRIAWNGIPAGAATVAIRAGDLFGKLSYEVEASAHTNAFVDLFWSFRGVAKATLFAQGLEPLHFVYERTARDVRQVTWIHFDLDPPRAHGVMVKGAQRKERAMEGAHFIDPITAVMRAELSRAKTGDVLRYEVFTGESHYRVQLTIAGLEPIEVPAGTFSSLRIVPQVWKIGHAARLDERLQHATIWVADTPMRTLLRIRSEVFIGAVTVDLVDLEA